MADTTLLERLTAVQVELKAPKANSNDFGGYKYRSAEDILEKVKPLLKKHNLAMTITDDITQVADRIYVKATVTVADSTQSATTEAVAVSAFAREALAKKGMDDAQITGSASSYARKYALNGMFAIDDTNNDPDSKDHSDYKPAQRADRTYNAIDDYAQRDNPTDAQRKMLWSLARELAIPDEDFKEQLKGITTKKEASKLIEQLQAKKGE